MTKPTKEVKRYTITAALPYANGPVHIGHLAGVYVPADIYVRYLRLKKKDVIFICGSDEHGVPITIKARQEGVSPQQIVDKYHAIIKKAFSDFDISFDIYSRTSNAIHHQTASDFFRTLFEKGEFIVKTQQQLYDEEQKQFLADRYVVGTCPRCSNEKAYGDQCENCGTSLSPTDLINPRSVLSGNLPVLKETKHWFLPLDKYSKWLSKWILEDHKDDWKTNVYGQCKSWLDHGLQPRAVTRDLDWGVQVPLEEAIGKVLYVWFDAPIGYISATREWAELRNQQLEASGKTEKVNWVPYWKDKDTKLIHFIGKDNIVFHCIVFPGMLKAEGSYILPDNVPANEFLNLEGAKISTSRNWAVWLHEYLQDFPGQQDVLRYVLTANAPETKDNDFTWKDFQTRNNSELLAIFGNFVNRTMVLTLKYFDGKVPDKQELTETDREVISQISSFPAKIEQSLEQYRFREALTELMNLARLGNKYLTETEPWKLFKTDENRVRTILNISLQVCANLAILSQPFLPVSSRKLLGMLNLAEPGWNEAGSTALLKAGHQLNQPALLFERIEDDAISKQVEKLHSTKQANSEEAPEANPSKPEITYEDFAKMDIRTGTILEAEKVAKTQKLLKLKIDIGIDKRTIVSGIAEFFKPEDLIGKQICMLVNLAPRNIRGTDSHGMILTVEDAAGTLYLISPTEVVNNGSEIK
ncbi:MAG: methionine--tRNA ligase [Bacteroidales bacterium]|nr:methionine--tRNA ligase [Bacteroidales bacterium]MDZ4205224.1 methionine--tRNA ligase [Bacteroidales bacterium]